MVTHVRLASLLASTVLTLSTFSAIAKVSDSNRTLRLQGTGPTVVLQSGLGDDKSAWNELIPELVREHTVVALDRPGHGENPPSPAPRDPCTIAAEQREAPRTAAFMKFMRIVAYSKVDRREIDAQAVRLERIDLSRPVAVAVKVLVADRFRSEETGKFEAMMRRARQRWLALTGAATLKEVSDSGHYIQQERPAVVAAAVRTISAGVPLR